MRIMTSTIPLTYTIDYKSGWKKYRSIFLESAFADYEFLDKSSTERSGVVWRYSVTHLAFMHSVYI